MQSQLLIAWKLGLTTPHGSQVSSPKSDTRKHHTIFGGNNMHGIISHDGMVFYGVMFFKLMLFMCGASHYGVGKEGVG